MTQPGPALFHWDGVAWSRFAAGTLSLLAADGANLLVFDPASLHVWSWDGNGWHDEIQLGPGMFAPQVVRRGETLAVLGRFVKAGPLYVRTSGKWQVITFPEEQTPGARLDALAIDDAGRVWVGGIVDSYGLLYRWDGVGLERLDWARSLPGIQGLAVPGQDLVVTTEVEVVPTVRVLSQQGDPRSSTPIPLFGGNGGVFVSSGGDTFALMVDSIQRLSSGGGWDQELGWANVYFVAGTGSREVWAAGRDLWHLDAAGWTRVASAPAVDATTPVAPSSFGALVAGELGEVWASSNSSILHWRAGTAESIPLPDPALTRIAASQGVLWGAAGSTLWRHDAAGWRAFDTGYPGPSVTLGDGEITQLAAVSADEVWASAYVEPPYDYSRSPPDHVALLHLARGSVEHLDASAYIAGVAQGPAGVFAFGSYRLCYDGVDVGGFFRVDAGALERIAGPSFGDLTSAPDGALFGIVHGPAVAGSTDAPPGVYRLAPGADVATGWTRLAPVDASRLWVNPDDGSAWATPGLWRTRAGTP